ncbi:hypothetical protein ACWCXB_33390 [Streptomyces sp. NPDC001514]
MLTSTFSVTEWWMAAIVSGIALALAARSTAITKREKLIATSVPLVLCAFMALSPSARGDEEPTPLMLYTLTALTLSILRVVFSRYFTRQLDLKRSGKPMEEMTGKQVTVFFATFVAVAVCIAVTL